MEYQKACDDHAVAWDIQTEAWNTLVRCAAEVDTSSVGAAWIAVDRARSDVQKMIKRYPAASSDLGFLLQSLERARGEIGSDLIRTKRGGVA